MSRDRILLERPPCASCGCRLASDNFGDRCTPCDRAQRYGSIPTTQLPIGLREVRARWAEGFEAFRDAAGLDDVAAAELALRLGLVRTRLLTASMIATMASSRTTQSTDFAQRWGVSRWTVAAWRTELGLERQPMTKSKPPTATPPVDHVEIRTGTRTRLVANGRSIRLGRSARTMVDGLVARYPEPALDVTLLAAMFPGVPSEQAKASLHAAVSRLRRHLPEGTIVRCGDGYRLNVPPSALR